MTPEEESLQRTNEVNGLTENRMCEVPSLPGISLRDYFFANEHDSPRFGSMELNAEFIGVDPGDYFHHEHYPKVLAKWRLMIVDAMLAERGGL